ncbi:hypothetical protein F5Y15DRAFT_369196 [Xylariaceae sp. FL0016]|nr:hypothetical protein F5Y15DRAFT_369196 [Xylariaceae sp. FL0016]
MPYRCHRWSCADPDEYNSLGWPRRYITYDYRTDCAECHEPSGLLRILQQLFGGPPTRCRHHKNHGWDHGWGGVVTGFARRKGCRNRSHHALAFKPQVDVDLLPPVIDTRAGRFRTRVPERCRHKTHTRHPGGHGRALGGYHEILRGVPTGPTGNGNKPVLKGILKNGNRACGGGVVPVNHHSQPVVTYPTPYVEINKPPHPNVHYRSPYVESYLGGNSQDHAVVEDQGVVWPLADPVGEGLVGE